MVVSVSVEAEKASGFAAAENQDRAKLQKFQAPDNLLPDPVVCALALPVLEELTQRQPVPSETVILCLSLEQSEGEIDTICCKQ